MSCINQLSFTNQSVMMPYAGSANTTCKIVSGFSLQRAHFGCVESTADSESTFAEQIREPLANKRRECGIVREALHG